MIHNIAHRGASAYAPDNTLAAFELAIQMGASMLELDVHLSRDGALVVIHDSAVQTASGQHTSVSQLTLQEIKRCDVGQGQTPPTLSEVIELARGRAELCIELKGQRTPEPVVRTLQGMSFEDQVVVGSFHPWLPQQVKYVAPQIRTSVLIGQEHRDENYVEWCLAVKADYVQLCWERACPQPHQLLTPELLCSIRQQGLGILLWHEERISELRELVKCDVDGICTNTPDVLASLLSGMRGERPSSTGG